MQRAPPRIVIVQPEDALRALLRAELVERGYDAIGAPDVASALTVPALAPDRDAVRMLLVEQAAAAAARSAELRRLLERHPLARRWLLASAWTKGREPAWERILRRPASIEHIVQEIERALKRS